VILSVEAKSEPRRTIDVAGNRAALKWNVRERAGRVLWDACRIVFRWSPRICWSWRCGLLRLFGAKIGKNVRIDPTARIMIPWQLEVGDWSAMGFDVLVYNLGPVRIGSRVTISQRAHLCAGSHDFRDPTMPLLKPPISIDDDAWVCADAFVGPGVRVGCGAVVGARAVVVKDVPQWSVVAGNPARLIRQRDLHGIT
jgi:putative colanic acid biosynthesis acetyltransferase WcaF